MRCLLLQFGVRAWSRPVLSISRQVRLIPCRNMWDGWEKEQYPPLVTAKWLHEYVDANKDNLGDSKVRILDGSWHLPFTGRKGLVEWRTDHIPGSFFFDLDDCADKSDPAAEHMMPSAEQFEEYVGKLGINNDSHVVVYDNNYTFGMFSAPRVWFMFKVFGHDRVSILDGGLPAWMDKTNMLVTDDVPTIKPETFKANFRPEMVKSFEDVETSIREKEDDPDKVFQLVDARPAGRFNGTAPEPRIGIKPGHVLGAQNIPFSFLMNATTKRVKGTKESLEKIFEGVMLYKPVTVMCGSGVTACNLAFALHLLKVKDVSLYDGSWMEWFQRAKHDMKVLKK
ncbi:3-mercaptopyruvate sulfurtransferase-like [Lineus longissimus]|uniref:3-mercaptopyruvate sulfurtransferase-like n=1 Tax=Lineus longissimus TaxID=88925 RepID=UPI002B4C8704